MNTHPATTTPDMMPTVVEGKPPDEDEVDDGFLSLLLGDGGEDDGVDGGVEGAGIEGEDELAGDGLVEGGDAWDAVTLPVGD